MSLKAFENSTKESESISRKGQSGGYKNLPSINEEKGFVELKRSVPPLTITFVSRDNGGNMLLNKNEEQSGLPINFRKLDILAASMERS